MIGFILADLRRLWLGSLVVVLLVALATALGVGVTLEERALRLGSARAADRFDLVIGAAGSESQLVLSTVFLQASPLPLLDGAVFTSLAADPRVAWVAPIGFGDFYQSYPIVGTASTLVNHLAGGFVEGRVFGAEDEAVIGAAVDLHLGDQVEPMHGTIEEGGHTHAELAYRIIGRLKPTGTAWDRAILVPIRAVWHIHGLDRHRRHKDVEAGHPALEEVFGADLPGLPAVLVKPKTIADAYRLRQDYRRDATLAVFPAEVLTRLYATLGDAKLVLMAVATGSQALVAAALLLVTVVHIGQRRRQIGALRALGAPRPALFAIVWVELFALLATGIGLGIAFGSIAAGMISARLAAKSGVILPIEFARGDLRLAAMLFGGAALLSVVPAIIAYRQSPAAALRAG